MVSAKKSIVIAWAIVTTVLGGCSSVSPIYEDQQVFANPKQAVNALLAAAKAHDMAALEAIFGSSGREVLSSGDPAADKMNRDVFITAMDQRWRLESIDGNTKELIVGHENWPFPIPLEMDKHGWWFDTVAGKEEVLARRIGRNELAVIGVLQTYYFAQREYAESRHDGKPAGIFAQKIRSDAGMHNGLYWPTAGLDEKPSPLSDFAAQASAQGYRTNPQNGPTPYYGFYYRVLTKQGSEADGGTMDYVVNGDMTGGFALIAFPAEYGNSGIMSFIIDDDAVIYEADLGPETGKIASEIAEFNPDARWLPAR